MTGSKRQGDTCPHQSHCGRAHRHTLLAAGSPAAARPASASASSTTADDDDDPSSASTPAPASPSENGGAHAHAGSAFAGGSSMAYDPRDLLLEAGEDARVGGKLPRLTLMEEVLLLGIKDKQGYLSFWNDNISYALRGCILIELALRRRIGVVKDPGRKRLPLPDRPLTVLSTRQTGETLLDETFKMMKQTEDSGERMGVGTWVDLLSGASCFLRLCLLSYPPSRPWPSRLCAGAAEMPANGVRCGTRAEYDEPLDLLFVHRSLGGCAGGDLYIIYRIRTSFGAPMSMPMPTPTRDAGLVSCDGLGLVSPAYAYGKPQRFIRLHTRVRRGVCLRFGETWNVLKIGFQLKQWMEVGWENEQYAGVCEAEPSWRRPTPLWGAERRHAGGGRRGTSGWRASFPIRALHAVLIESHGVPPSRFLLFSHLSF
ncbi:Golgi phosphoprotein 3-domain-containing protein [Mycena olivaceomarginata]|nr:Golgi phosphoprotein 3-domain-containing protein [Mycena olivaceomarginata]